MAIAVTSQGVRCAGIILMPGVEWRLAYDVLTLVLEMADPEPVPKQNPKAVSGRHLSLIRIEETDLLDDATDGTNPAIPIRDPASRSGESERAAVQGARGSRLPA